jgi:hypothetical protein
MRTATGARRLERSGDDRTEKRWLPGSFIALACVVLLAFAAFAQQPPARVSIRPTGPMPGVSVP